MKPWDRLVPGPCSRGPRAADRPNDLFEERAYAPFSAEHHLQRGQNSVITRCVLLATRADFDANPHTDAATVHTLAGPNGSSKGRLSCLIGDSGTGESHMLFALGPRRR